MPPQETKAGKNIFVFSIYQIISIRIYFHFLNQRLLILYLYFIYSVLENRWKYYFQLINSMLNLIGILCRHNITRLAHSWATWFDWCSVHRMAWKASLPYFSSDHQRWATKWHKNVLYGFTVTSRANCSKYFIYFIHLYCWLAICIRNNFSKVISIRIDHRRSNE